MVPRSTRSKLKTVFVATIIILAIAIPGYFYVQSQVPKEASFQVADLVLDQNLVQVGEKVQISINVTNVGDKTGNYSVTVTIDDEPTAT